MIVVLVNGDILSSDKYSIELKTTGEATVQGSLKLSTDIDIRDLKYLKMSSVNPEEPIFYNDDSQYPPDQNIEVEVY